MDNYEELYHICIINNKGDIRKVFKNIPVYSEAIILRNYTNERICGVLESAFIFTDKKKFVNINILKDLIEKYEVKGDGKI